MSERFRAILTGTRRQARRANYDTAALLLLVVMAIAILAWGAWLWVNTP
jgi:hypothetical protein